MKTPNFTESDFLVASQDTLLKLVKDHDSEGLKNLIINRLENYNLTHNQYCFLYDVCANLVK